MKSLSNKIRAQYLPFDLTFLTLFKFNLIELSILRGVIEPVTSIQALAPGQLECAEVSLNYE